jgi:quercetin dioxygenase-like cupin family protein
VDVPVLSSPASIRWTSVQPGVETSVLLGSPEEAGTPFVVLVRTAIPVVTEAHVSSREEHVTVLDGQLQIGVGDASEGQPVQTLGPGSYAVIPRGLRHFLRCAAGSLLQIHGIGPFAPV